MINKYKLEIFPHGVVFTIVEVMTLKHTPKDTPDKLRMNAELEQLVFRKAKNFHTQILSVMAKFGILKTERECFELLAKKVQNPRHAKMIIDHLDGSNYDLKKLCTEIAKI